MIHWYSWIEIRQWPDEIPFRRIIELKGLVFDVFMIFSVQAFQTHVPIFIAFLSQSHDTFFLEFMIGLEVCLWAFFVLCLRTSWEFDARDIANKILLVCKNYSNQNEKTFCIYLLIFLWFNSDEFKRLGCNRGRNPWTKVIGFISSRFCFFLFGLSFKNSMPSALFFFNLLFVFILCFVTLVPMAITISPVVTSHARNQINSSPTVTRSSRQSTRLP